MAQLLGINYAKTQASPKDRVDPSEYNARSKVIHEKFVNVVGSPILNGDTIQGMKIPEGALIHDAKIKIGNGGATGILDLGHGAGLDIDGNAIAADSDGFVQQADAGGQTVFKRADNGSASIGFKVGQGGLDILATCTEDFVNDVTVEFWVEYSLES